MRLVSPADAVISHIIGIKATEPEPTEAAAAPEPEVVKKGRRKKRPLLRRRKRKRRSSVLCPGLLPVWAIRALSTSVRTTTWAFSRLTGWPSATAIRVTRTDSKALLGVGVIGGRDVLLAKPQTFMNLSGTSVKALVDKYSVEPAK